MALTSKTLAEAITFTRSSQGGYYDLNGRYTLAAANEARIDFDPGTGEKLGLLIEESRTNNVLRSNDISTWGNFGANGAVARLNIETSPEGTITADSIESLGSIDDRKGYQKTITNTLQVITMSVFLKAGSSGEARMSWIDFAGGNAQAYTQTIDLTTGVITPIAGTPDSAASRQLQDGWWRVSITATRNDALNTNMRMDVGPNSTTVGENIYIWGAQIEEGAFPTSYIPSTETFTSRASTATYYDSAGVLQSAAIDVERINYNPADLTAPGKQLFEEERTNTCLQSEDFNTTWAKRNSAGVTTNTAVAPNGTLTGDTITGLSADNDKLDQSIGIVGGSTYTASIYVKGVPGETVNFNLASQGGTFTSINTTIVLTSDWVRHTVTLEMNGDNTAVFVVVGNDDGVVTASSVDVWGAQVEQGAYPTSYIPTTTLQVTRSADVYSSAQSTRAADSVQVNEFPTWFNQPAWSVIFETQRFGNDAGSFGRAISVELGGSGGAERAAIAISGGSANSNDLYALVVSGGNNTYAFDAVPAPVGEFAKIGFSLSPSYSQVVKDGVQDNFDTDVVLPSADKMGLCENNYNGHLKSVKYYSRALSKAELEELTA